MNNIYNDIISNKLKKYWIEIIEIRIERRKDINWKRLSKRLSI